MNLKIICLMAAAILFLGCATDGKQVTSQAVTDPQLASEAGTGGAPGLVFDPFAAEELGLPRMGDTLPVPQRILKTPRLYTGIIKNRTAYDVNIPSKNSAGTLTIPARGWTEFIAWEKDFDLTVYHDGKPFYCLQVMAHPGEYPFMCKKYDFIAEIVKPEAVHQYPGKKKKKRIRKKKAAVG
jgi:hypothetical protein